MASRRQYSARADGAPPRTIWKPATLAALVLISVWLYHPLLRGRGQPAAPTPPRPAPTAPPAAVRADAHRPQAEGRPAYREGRPRPPGGKLTNAARAGSPSPSRRPDRLAGFDAPELQLGLLLLEQSPKLTLTVPQRRRLLSDFQGAERRFRDSYAAVLALAWILSPAWAPAARQPKLGASPSALRTTEI